MSENVDLSLVLERLNEVLSEVRGLRTEVAEVKRISANAATRSQFLALAETMSQFDNLLSVLDARVASIEARR